MTLVPRNYYLDDFFDDLDLARGPRIHNMKCDVYEKEGNYHIIMDIPGFSKKDIQIECENGILTITAEKSSENEIKNDRKYIKHERVYGKVSRSFSFADINEENISAQFENGILRITIPKTKKEDAKKIIEIN